MWLKSDHQSQKKGGLTVFGQYSCKLTIQSMS